MTRRDRSRRSFLKTCVALVGTTPLIAGMLHAHSSEPRGPLLAYVGTFSSPLRDVLPTQVDLSPGNGRGIHIFQVNRNTGALTPTGICEMGTSPSCLALNRKNGGLRFTGHYIPVGNPSSIVFLDLAKVD